MKGSTADIVPVLCEIPIEAVQIVQIAADKLNFLPTHNGSKTSIEEQT